MNKQIIRGERTVWHQDIVDGRREVSHVNILNILKLDESWCLGDGEKE